MMIKTFCDSFIMFSNASLWHELLGLNTRKYKSGKIEQSKNDLNKIKLDLFIQS